MRMKRKPKYIFMVILLLVLLSITLFLFYSFTLQKEVAKKIVPNYYEKEIVLIADGEDSQFWQNVYESAQKQAKKQNAYLEWMEQDSLETYTIQDYMRIAIHSNVDGILIHPDGSSEIRQLIDEAESKHIPVITLVDDDTQSKRISCIGLNAYQMGIVYAQQINQLMTSETNLVDVLLDEKDTTNNDIIFNQMKTNIKAQRKGENNLSIQMWNISSQNTFDSEEAIRNIFIDTKHLPNILVCLSDTDTQAACQAIVDYNQVGNVSIIGYYLSDVVKNALKKGVIQSVVVPDTKQIGKKAIETMVEYEQNGNVSDFTSIDLNVITKKNISK